MWDLVLQGLGAGVPMLPRLLGMEKEDQETYGGLFGLGAGLLQGIVKPFAFGDGGGGGGGGGGAASPENKGALSELQQRASFAATGGEGAQANREAAEAARKFIGQQTADSRLAQMQQQALGSQALGGAQATTDLARSATLMNLGNQRRDLMQQAAAAGGSPAALAGVAGNLGQSSVQALNTLAQQGAQAQQQGISTAGQAFTSGENIRNADLAQQLANFQPYSVQKFSPTSASGLAGLASAASTAAGTSAMEDPLALLKQMTGKGANIIADRGFTQDTFEEMLRKAMMSGKFGSFS